MYICQFLYDKNVSLLKLKNLIYYKTKANPIKKNIDNIKMDYHQFFYDSLSIILQAF